LRLDEVVTQEKSRARFDVAGTLKDSAAKNFREEFIVACKEAAAVRIAQHGSEPQTGNCKIDRWTIVIASVEKIKEAGDALKFFAAFGENILRFLPNDRRDRRLASRVDWPDQEKHKDEKEQVSHRRANQLLRLKLSIRAKNRHGDSCLWAIVLSDVFGHRVVPIAGCLVGDAFIFLSREHGIDRTPRNEISHRA